LKAESAGAPATINMLGTAPSTSQYTGRYADGKGQYDTPNHPYRPAQAIMDVHLGDLR
jgi:hypothetical protein